MEGLTLSEMTHNEALQELQRFVNVWQAASNLRDALQIAANLESAKQQLETERRNLEDKVHRLEALVAERQKDTRAAMDEAERGLQELLLKVEAEEKRAKQEHDEAVARLVTSQENATAQIHQEIVAARKAAGAEILALDQEISDKRALVAELDEQLDHLRKRLG
jgi:hypothetical protein